MAIKRWMAAAAVLMTALIGCGGKVIVDGLPAGQGGAGVGGHGTGGSGQGNGGASCMDPPDPSTLKNCGGNAATTGSGPIMCISDLCDSSNNKFESSCQGSVCHCLVNGEEKCTCVLNEPGTFCSGTNLPCCPWEK
jgi:hypothetical protein